MLRMGVSLSISNLINLLPSKDPTEKFCNRVAAELLVPAYKLNEVWPEVSQKSDRFLMIAKQFKVSPLVIARRALDLKLISKPEFFKFYKADRDDFLSRKKKLKNKDKSGGNFYATQNVRLGRPFSAAIVRATREGRILIRDAYRLTGLKGQTFDKYSKRVQERVRNERE